MKYKKIGKIVRTLGLDGQLLIKTRLQQPKLILEQEHVFLELQKESFIPFFPEGSAVLTSADEISVYLDDITDIDTAAELVGKEVYIEEQIYHQLFQQHSTLDEDLSGFTLKDIASGNSGTITDTFVVSGQLLANVLYRDKDLLIPLSEDFLDGIDVAKKIIILRLPVGIWNI